MTIFINYRVPHTCPNDEKIQWWPNIVLRAYSLVREKHVCDIILVGICKTAVMLNTPDRPVASGGKRGLRDGFSEKVTLILRPKK